MSEDSGPVLLYDGLCGFCDRAVRLILRADRRRVFRFAALDSEFARGVIARHPHLRDIDSLMLVEPAGDDAPEQVHVRSEGFLRSMRLLGGAWRILAVFALAPRPLRDWGYDAFARHRYRVFGRLEACPVPDQDVRARFLD